MSSNRNNAKSSGNAPPASPVRASRRIARQKPEIEVFARSRGQTPPIDLDNSKSISPVQIIEVKEDEENDEKDEENKVEKIENPIEAPMAPTEPQLAPIEIIKPNESIKPDESINIEPEPEIEEVEMKSENLNVKVSQADSMEVDGPVIASMKDPTIIALNSIKEDTEEYWTGVIKSLGIKRLNLTIGPPNATERYNTAEQSDSEDDRELTELNAVVDAVPDDKKKKNSKKKKRAVVKRPPKEDMSETEEEKQARLLREKRNELEALQELKGSLESFESALKNEILAPNVLAVSQIFAEFLEELSLELIQEVHHSIILGDIDPKQNLAWVTGVNGNVDIFGQEVTAFKPDSLLCDEGCGRMVASNRYAPHLEKCTNLPGSKSKGSRRNRVDTNYENFV